MKIRIRNYENDYEDVKQNLIEGGLYVPFLDTKKRFIRKIERYPDSIIVAEADNNVVGNLFIIEDGWCAFIYHVAVRLAYRNRGIATRLLQEAERRLKGHGASSVALYVEENLKDVVNHYKKHGYTKANKYRLMYKIIPNRHTCKNKIFLTRSPIVLS